MRTVLERGRIGLAKPIYKKILIPVIVLVILEILLLVGSIFGGGLTAHLDQNARDILNEKILNRKSYLEGQMIQSWSQLEFTVADINEQVESMLQQGTITKGDLNQGSGGCTQLLSDLSEKMISILRSNKVTGAYVVFNTEDLDEGMKDGAIQYRPGLYLRDLDPGTTASFQNGDLLVACAPGTIVKELNIAMSNGWKPQFQIGSDEDKTYEFIRAPYQEAYESQRRGEGLNWLDFGFWYGPASVSGSEDEEAIYYSVPLILSDGTVYGVLGVDVSTAYLKRVIPYSEIADDRKGTYVLGVTDTTEASADGVKFRGVLVNGPMVRQAMGSEQVLELKGKRGTYVLQTNDETFYCGVEYLNLYNSNAPFSHQRWALIGTVREDDLYSFSSRITRNMMTAIFFTLLAGVAGSFLVSLKISRPVAALVKDIGVMNTAAAIHLKRTGIEEIDRLESAIEVLSHDVIDSATKFTQIMELASVKIAAFEEQRDSGQLFITDGFFEIFHQKGINTKRLTVKDFDQIMKGLDQYIDVSDRGTDSVIYRVDTKTGPAFIKLKYVDDGIRRIGLAEDVTQNVEERDRIEYERDHDLLTGLINRRAFSRIMRQLFQEEPDSLKIAALLMLDLDNLKLLNDTFGHDCGDKYIRRAADCFGDALPPGAILSRISGDEFYVFFYGYDTKEEIRKHLKTLEQSIQSTKFYLPNQQFRSLMASGGVAWYPDDSQDYEELLRFSDFAMYRVKQSGKGTLQDFDLNLFNRESNLLENKAALTELIEKSLVCYHFQPIVDARTGEIFGYEALMRGQRGTLRSPLEILELARMESKLDQIERLTVMESMKAFSRNVEQGKIAPDCRLFLNTIASVHMTDQQTQDFARRYQPYLKNIVLELTEEERVNEASLEHKRQWIKKWNAAMALDDYGSGYNSERMLLQLSPEFIKVDIAIIRNINNDSNKQKIVENVVSYAHERGILIVAEGVETEEEIRTLIGMQVDYFQGFWFSKPDEEPPQISERCRDFVLEENRNAGRTV